MSKVVGYEGLGYGVPEPKGFQPAPRYGYKTSRTRIEANADTLARYGRTWSAATAAQRANRAADRYSGAGRYRRRRKRRRRYRGRGSYGAPLYRGRGGFWSDAVKKGGWLRSGGLDLVQTGLGNIPVVGGVLGNAFGGIRKATGIGDYNISSNVLVEGNPMGSMPGTFEAPSFTEISDTGGIVISHREFIGNMYAPAQGEGFKTQQFTINPGIEQTFPWLSQIAANYQDYSIKQLIFSFKTTVSNFQTKTGVTGTVLSVTQKDPYAADYEDKSEIMQAFGSVSCKATDNQVAGVECDPSIMSGDPIRHIRVAGLPDKRDPIQYDWGRFIFALSDFPEELANANIGEIWVSYTVELLRPRVFTGKGSAITTAKHYLLPTSTQSGLSSMPSLFDTGLFLTYDNSAQEWKIGGGSQMWDFSSPANQFINSKNSIDVALADGPLYSSTVDEYDNMIFVAPPKFQPGGPGTPTEGFTQIACSLGQSPWYQTVMTLTAPITNTTVANSTRSMFVTFPASFSGTVCLKWEQVLACTECGIGCMDVQASGNIKPVHDIIAPSQGSANFGADFDVGAPCANTAVAFITSANYGESARKGGVGPGPYPNPFPDRAGAPANSVPRVGRLSCELHIEVKAVTGGVNNTLLIRASNWASITAWPGASPTFPTQSNAKVLQCSLEVSEYNSDMSDNLDVPLIVNQQTGQRLVQARSEMAFD